MAIAGDTTELVLALGRYDAFLAKRHVETFGGDPAEVLRQVMEAREKQLLLHLGRLYFGGWWPGFSDDIDVLPVMPAALAEAS